jgi:hypothetical protein
MKLIHIYTDFLYVALSQSSSNTKDMQAFPAQYAAAKISMYIDLPSWSEKSGNLNRLRCRLNNGSVLITLSGNGRDLPCICIDENCSINPYIWHLWTKATWHHEKYAFQNCIIPFKKHVILEWRFERRLIRKNRRRNTARPHFIGVAVTFSGSVNTLRTNIKKLWSIFVGQNWTSNKLNQDSTMRMKLFMSVKATQPRLQIT